MLRKTRLKRTLWTAALVSAAALAPGCRHPQYAAGGAGAQGGSIQGRSSEQQVRRGIDPTRDNIHVPNEWARPPADTGVGGAGPPPLANPGDPYSRPADFSEHELRLKEKQAHPRQPPDRPYIDPWDNSENPAAVGGSGAG